MSAGLEHFHSRFVYRVLRPDEDPTSDLLVLGPLSKRTIDQHVATGLKLPSKYISTTSNMKDARKWMTTANKKSSGQYKNKRNIIVKIDIELLKSKYPHVTDDAIDLSNPLNRDKYLRSQTQKSYAAAYSEVVFSDVIPVEAVSIVNQDTTTPRIQIHNVRNIRKPLPQQVVDMNQIPLPSLDNQVTPVSIDTESDYTFPPKSTVCHHPVADYDDANGRGKKMPEIVASKLPDKRGVRKKPVSFKKIQQPVSYMSPSPLHNLIQIILLLK